MDKIQKSMCIYVAYLRAISIIHQNNHWTCSGNAFYQHHLLFERIYQTSQDDADLAAEKVVGLFGKESLTLAEQAECINKILQKFNQENLIENSLNIEKEFLTYSKNVYDILKSDHKDQMSLGLDDMIMSICSHRETAAYLLSQSL